MTQDFQSAFERYRSEHYVVNGVTPERQVEQQKVLEEFDAFIGDRPLVEATADDIYRYMASCIERGLHVNTVRKRLGMIKPFFNWLWTKRFVSAEQIMDIRDVKAPRGSSSGGRPNPYPPKELATLWPAINARWPRVSDLTQKRWRNGTTSYRRVWRHAMNVQVRCIVTLALDLGLRRVEIHRLTIKDIHPDNAYVVVHGKRDNGHVDKVRQVPLTDSARSAIVEWFRWRRAIGPTHDSPWLHLWPRSPAEPMTADQLAHMMSYIGEGWRLHRLRHTCATERLRAGMEIEALKEFMGHARIEQTLQYAQIVGADVAKKTDRIEAAFQRRLGKRAA